MLQIPTDLVGRYDFVLEGSGVALSHRRFYRKWLRYYLDFCHKYRFDHLDKESFSAFNDKLREKNQSQSLRKQACHAVSLYHGMTGPAKNSETGDPHPHVRPANPNRAVLEKKAIQTHRSENRTVNTTSDVPSLPSQTALRSPVANTSRMPLTHSATSESHLEYHREKARDDRASALQVSEKSNTREDAVVRQTGASWECVFDKPESAVKVRHYSPKTLKA